MRKRRCTGKTLGIKMAELSDEGEGRNQGLRCWYRGIEFQVDTCWIGFEIPQQVRSERVRKTPAWSHELECEVCKARPRLPGSP